MREGCWDIVVKNRNMPEVKCAPLNLAKYSSGESFGVTQGLHEPLLTFGRSDHLTGAVVDAPQCVDQVQVGRCAEICSEEQIASFSSLSCTNLEDNEVGEPTCWIILHA